MCLGDNILVCGSIQFNSIDLFQNTQHEKQIKHVKYIISQVVWYNFYNHEEICFEKD